MPVPQQVLDQMNEAQNVAREAQGLPTVVVDETLSEIPSAFPPRPTVAAPVDSPPAPPAPVPVVPPATPTVAPPVVEPVPDPAPAPVTTDWEHKYKVLQGMFNAEKRRGADETALLRDQVAHLTAQVQRLEQARNEQPEVTPPAPPAQIDPDQLQRWKDDYGDDLVNMVQAQVRALTPQAPQPAPAQQPADMNQFMSEIHEIRLERFYDQLYGAAPDAADLEANPEFQGWLKSTRIPGTQTTYGEQLTESLRAYDAVTAAEICNLFKTTRAGVPSPSPYSPAVAAQVVPQPGAAPAAPPSKPRLTTAQVNAMTQEALQIRQENPARSAQLQNQIREAYYESRVDP